MSMAKEPAAFRVTREDNGDGGIYRAWDAEGTLAGYMTYKIVTSSEWSLDHTKVEEAFGGQGVGQRLLDAALGDARAKGRKLRPVCSFVRHFFDKFPAAVADVRAAAR